MKVSIVWSLRDREVACSASDRQGSNFESCVWRAVSSQSSHHPQEVLLAQFSLYVHKGGLKPDLFHFQRPHFSICITWFSQNRDLKQIRRHISLSTAKSFASAVDSIIATLFFRSVTETEIDCLQRAQNCLVGVVYNLQGHTLCHITQLLDNFNFPQ